MARNPSRYFLVLSGIPLLSASCLTPIHAQQQEWEKNSPYYEDDAWYDISEWLDSNDYNPTDEAIGRWDDEQYDSNIAESDHDDDASGLDSTYGYDDTDTNDDWFYDYYDNNHGYYDGLLEDDWYSFSSRYYDYDDDGFYDAYSSYADTDGDGLYEDYDYYSFNSDLDFDTNNSTASTSSSDSQSQDNQSQSNTTQTAESANNGSNQQQQAASQQKDLSSKRLAVSGTIERAKQVQVPKGPVRLVAEVKGENQQNLLVDLGPANQFGTQSSANQQAGSNQQQSGHQQAGSQGPQVLKKGEKIVAHGPAIKVGEKKLILAQTVKIGNQDQREILRAGNTVTGTISKMKTAEVRGLEHQLAILDLKSGKQALVDLGRKENLPKDLREGDQIQVTGIPTKIKDRLVFIANTIAKDGDKTKIHRMTASASSHSGASSSAR